MLRRSEARVQFYAVRDEVNKLITEGYGIRLAYDKLCGSNKISMSYKSFYNYVKKEQGRSASPSASSLPPSSSSIQSSEEKLPVRRLGVGNSEPVIKKPTREEVI